MLAHGSRECHIIETAAARDHICEGTRKRSKVSHFAFTVGRERHDRDDAGAKARKNQWKKLRRVGELNENAVPVTQSEPAQVHGERIRVPVQVSVRELLFSGNHSDAIRPLGSPPPEVRAKRFTFPVTLRSISRGRIRRPLYASFQQTAPGPTLFCAELPVPRFSVLNGGMSTRSDHGCQMERCACRI